MIAHTTIPLKFMNVPKLCRVEAVFATVVNPYTQEPQRVRVRGVRLCGLVDPVKYADVIGLHPNARGFSVPAASLKNVCAFVTMES